MGFADVAQQALQPNILGLDPSFARGLLVRDLNRVGAAQQTQRADQRRGFDTAVQLAEKTRKSGQQGYGFLQPKARTPRYTPVGNQSQYLVDALLKQASLDEYDRRAPLLREDLARARP